MEQYRSASTTIIDGYIKAVLIPSLKVQPLLQTSAALDPVEKIDISIFNDMKMIGDETRYLESELHPAIRFTRSPGKIRSSRPWFLKRFWMLDTKFDFLLEP